MKSNMDRVLFVINTPGQVYTWRNLIQELRKQGISIKLIVRDSVNTLKVLEGTGLNYSSFSDVGTRFTRWSSLLLHFQHVYTLSKEFNPSLIFGFGVDAAITAARLKARCILFIDDDHTKYQNILASLFANVIFTPQCFLNNLGRKQQRIAGYKELAYLHPNHFTPDPKIFDELNILPTEKYVIMRFNAFKAIHDIGQRGFSDINKIEIVKSLANRYKVFISPEGKLPYELEPYKIPILPHRIHHALYYAQMIIGDTGTMSVEAAVLGTPAIRYYPLTKYFGNYLELEEKYGLLYTHRTYNEVITHALRLLEQPETKELWAKKKENMLSEKIDVAKFMIEFTNKYIK
jgi:uncharacterized protein